MSNITQTLYFEHNSIEWQKLIIPRINTHQSSLMNSLHVFKQGDVSKWLPIVPYDFIKLILIQSDNMLYQIIHDKHSAMYHIISNTIRYTSFLDDECNIWAFWWYEHPTQFSLTCNEMCGSVIIYLLMPNSVSFHMQQPWTFSIFWAKLPYYQQYR